MTNFGPTPGQLPVKTDAITALPISNAERRILVIHDSWRGTAFFKLTSEGISIEVTLVRDINQALEQLARWEADGQRPDIITIDLHKSLDGNPLDIVLVAPKYTQKIQEYLSQQINQRQPQIFWNSTGLFGPSIYLPEGISFHPEMDLFCLEVLADGGLPWVGLDEPKSLLAYINKTFGTKLITTQEEVRNAKIDRGLLGLWSLADDVHKGKFTEPEALKGVDPSFFFLYPQLDKEGFVGRSEGFNDSTGGAAVGVLAFDAKDVERLNREGKPAILVVKDIEPNHMDLLPHITGLIALGREPSTAHAKILLGSHGIAALFGDSHDVFKLSESVAGWQLIRRPNSEDQVGYQLCAGAWVSIDDGNGLYPARLPLIQRPVHESEQSLASWGKELCTRERGMRVNANADSAQQVREAISQGVEGIGLVRTEHMFFDSDSDSNWSLDVLRNVLLKPEAQPLAIFKAFQQERFEKLLRAANEAALTITVRLLDAPPEEFLSKDQLESFLQERGADHVRGSRFALKAPELYEAQLKALFEAATEVEFRGQLDVMIPLVHSAEELRTIKATYDKISKEHPTRSCRFGAMIETRGACEDAHKIAELCDFVSFGTNDLTSAIVGCRRQDIKSTEAWMEKNSVRESPFITLAPQVMEVIEDTVQKLRASNPTIQVGICGEQVSGDWPSIKFCDRAAFDSISVRPTERVLVLSQIMAGKACALALPPEKLSQRLKSYRNESRQMGSAKTTQLIKELQGAFGRLNGKPPSLSGDAVSDFIELAGSLFALSTVPGPESSDLGSPHQPQDGDARGVVKNLIQRGRNELLKDVQIATRCRIMKDLWPQWLGILSSLTNGWQQSSDSSVIEFAHNLSSWPGIVYWHMKILARGYENQPHVMPSLDRVQRAWREMVDVLDSQPPSVRPMDRCAVVGFIAKQGLILDMDIYTFPVLWRVSRPAHGADSTQ